MGQYHGSANFCSRTKRRRPARGRTNPRTTEAIAAHRVLVDTSALHLTLKEAHSARRCQLPAAAGQVRSFQADLQLRSRSPGIVMQYPAGLHSPRPFQGLGELVPTARSHGHGGPLWSDLHWQTKNQPKPRCRSARRHPRSRGQDLARVLHAIRSGMVRSGVWPRRMRGKPSRC